MKPKGISILSTLSNSEMKILEIIKTRRSTRRFREEDVSEEDLMKILEAAIWAPSAGNRQPWEFIIVKDKHLKEKIAEAAYNQKWMTTAPVIIVICADEMRSASRYGERGRSLYCIQDTAAATQNILLAAHALNYGTCWVGAFDENRVKEILGIPRNVRPVALIPIGRADEHPKPPSRIPLERLIHRDGY